MESLEVSEHQQKYDRKKTKKNMKTTIKNEIKINTDSLLIIFNKGRNIIKKENIKKIKYFGYEQRRI